MSKSSVFAGAILIAVIAYQQYQIQVLQDLVIEIKDDMITVLSAVLKEETLTKYQIING